MIDRSKRLFRCEIGVNQAVIGIVRVWVVRFVFENVDKAVLPVPTRTYVTRNEAARSRLGRGLFVIFSTRHPEPSAAGLVVARNTG